MDRAVLYVMLILFSFLGTLAIRHVARKKKLLDRPNDRSSHTVATPHGGGLAIMLAFYAGLGYLYLTGAVERGLFYALLCGIPVMVISQLDDIYGLSAKGRFSVQVASALAALYALDGVDSMAFGVFTLEGGWINVFALLLLLWYTNLYNFLDGIDGYAGSEAVFVGISGFILFGSEIGLLVATASVGFLIFNWHKASIFMGDVGSAPLGFLFAVLTLNDAGSSHFLGWLVLLSLFWFDATVTLWRRWRNGERLSQAHKKHAYQRLYQSGIAHDGVVLRAMGLNLLLLLLLLVMGPERFWAVLLAAVALLWWAMSYVDRQKAFS